MRICANAPSLQRLNAIIALLHIKQSKENRTSTAGLVISYRIPGIWSCSITHSYVRSSHDSIPKIARGLSLTYAFVKTPLQLQPQDNDFCVHLCVIGRRVVVAMDKMCPLRLHGFLSRDPCVRLDPRDFPVDSLSGLISHRW